MKLEWIADIDIPGNTMQIMETAAQFALTAEGIDFPCSVCVRLCDDETILEINQSCRGISLSTDVLSFPTVQYPPGKTAGACLNLLKKEYDDENHSCFLGDIIISVPHIISQAEEYGHSFEREATYLLVHGLCHLMGYDHMNGQEKKTMRAMEEKILSLTGIQR